MDDDIIRLLNIRARQTGQTRMEILKEARDAIVGEPTTFQKLVERLKYPDRVTDVDRANRRIFEETGAAPERATVAEKQMLAEVGAQVRASVEAAIAAEEKGTSAKSRSRAKPEETAMDNATLRATVDGLLAEARASALARLEKQADGREGAATGESFEARLKAAKLGKTPGTPLDGNGPLGR